MEAVEVLSTACGDWVNRSILLTLINRPVVAEVNKRWFVQLSAPQQDPCHSAPEAAHAIGYSCWSRSGNCLRSADAQGTKLRTWPTPKPRLNVALHSARVQRPRKNPLGALSTTSRLPDWHARRRHRNTCHVAVRHLIILIYAAFGFLWHAFSNSTPLLPFLPRLCWRRTTASQNYYLASPFIRRQPPTSCHFGI